MDKQKGQKGTQKPQSPQGGQKRGYQPNTGSQQERERDDSDRDEQ